jgi:hypothetical protein
MLCFKVGRARRKVDLLLMLTTRLPQHWSAQVRTLSSPLHLHDNSAAVTLGLLLILAVMALLVLMY